MLLQRRSRLQGVDLKHVHSAVLNYMYNSPLLDYLPTHWRGYWGPRWTPQKTLRILHDAHLLLQLDKLHHPGEYDYYDNESEKDYSVGQKYYHQMLEVAQKSEQETVQKTVKGATRKAETLFESSSNDSGSDASDAEPSIAGSMGEDDYDFDNFMNPETGCIRFGEEIHKRDLHRRARFWLPARGKVLHAVKREFKGETCDLEAWETVFNQETKVFLTEPHKLGAFKGVYGIAQLRSNQ